jgi:hypothetical protein
MYPVAWLGISPAELNEKVDGEVWARWVEAEPDLAGFSGLDELHAIRGAANDPPLGALVRLAATDGGDDALAATALCHQLEPGARHLMHDLRDLSRDIDEVVMATLWLRIRSFPWRRRRRAYAANILRDTRAAVLRDLCRWGYRKQAVPVDPQSCALDWMSNAVDGGVAGSEESARDLVDFLGWALVTGVIDRSDGALMLELVAAGHEVCDRETPWTRRGVCSQAAVARVAATHGVSRKTVFRRRDRIVAVLRDSAPVYLTAVA